MGFPVLPDEPLLLLTEQWPCRDNQLRQLSALLSPSLPSHSTLVVHGSQATGKSGTVKTYLEQSRLDHAIVRCRESVTGRHLLERTVDAIRRALRTHVNGEDHDFNGQCENLGAFTVHLQRLLASREKFVLVFDDIDKQREAPPTLLPTLARLGETITGLSVVLIVQHAPSHFLHQNGVVHIRFSPYSRDQAVHILSQSPPEIFLETPPEELEYNSEVHDEDKNWLWPRFCAAVWDALAHNAARDLAGFRDVCYKLWRPFVTPIIKGDFGTRDFSRLLVAQRRLFQDESILLDTITSTSEATPDVRSTAHELPYFTRWLLVAAYLASFNPARMDAIYFMKATERRRRKKGGGTARSGGGRPGRNRRIPRHLLAASTFTLDRLLAILHALLPDDLRTTTDIHKQVSTLASLRLLQRAGSIGSGDALEPGGKWKVGPMVTWEYTQGLARSLDLTLADYLAE